MTLERNDAPIDEVVPRPRRRIWLRYALAVLFAVMVINRFGPTIATYLGHGGAVIALPSEKQDHPLGGNAH